MSDMNNKIKSLEKFIIKLCASLDFDLENLKIEIFVALSNNSDLKSKILECFDDELKLIDNDDLIIENTSVKSIIKFCLKKYGYKIIDFTNDDDFEINYNEFEFDDLSLDFPNTYRLFINDISKRPLLTPNEERNLFLEYKKTHNPYIRNLVLESNLRLVISISKHFLDSGIEFLDLIQSGSEGLTKAFDKFDIEKGYKFSTYATWWIRQAMILTIKNESRSIRISVGTHNKLNKLKRTEEMLCNRLFRKPTIQEIANEMNMSSEKIIYLQKIRQKTVSLDKPLEQKDTDDYDNTLLSTVSDGADFATAIADNDFLLNAFRAPSLTEQEKDVILKYYFDDMKLEEIGLLYNTSRQRIFQIREKALGKMRKYNHIY